MDIAGKLLLQGSCKGIRCQDCPIPGLGCEVPLRPKAVEKLKKLAGISEVRYTTLRERLEEYEKAHRALWQECKDDLNAMFEDSGD